MVLPFKLTPPRIVALAAVTFFLLWCLGSAVTLFFSHASLSRAWADVEAAESARVVSLQEVETALASVAPFAPDALNASSTARKTWNEASTITEQVAAIHALDTAEAQLRVTASEYGQVATLAAFTTAQRVLQQARSEAEAMRLAYDEAVKLFNVRLLVFPRNVLAGLFGIEPAPRFKFAESGPSSWERREMMLLSSGVNGTLGLFVSTLRRFGGAAAGSPRVCRLGGFICGSH